MGSEMCIRDSVKIRILVFVVTTRRAPVNSKGGYFDDQVLAKRRLLPNATEGGTLFFYACGDYMRS